MSAPFILNNGEALHLEACGGVSPETSDGRHTIVTVHGLGGGGYFFSGLARSHSFGGRTLLPDMPGSGFSGRWNRPITFDRFADAVVQLIERNASGPVSLVGHSMGTIVALKVYARIPDRVASMVFVGGLPAPLPEAQDRLRDRAEMARSAGMAAV